MKLIPHIINSETIEKFKKIHPIVELLRLIIGGAMAILAFVITNFLNDNREWSIYEFGRHYDKCKFGEIILTSKIAPDGNKSIKMTAGYAHKNEKYWIDNIENKKEIHLRSKDGNTWVYELGQDEKTFLLKYTIGNNSDKKNTTVDNRHYLYLIYSPSIIGGISERSSGLNSKTCPGFQSTD